MIGVLQRNPEFRKLWIAQVTSGTGDWLNRVALLGLIAEFGGERAAWAGVGTMFALELVSRMLPDAFMSPLAGPTADRLSRKGLMIASDVANSVLVLGFLFIRDASDELWIYPLLIAQKCISMFFHSARQGALPNTVPKEDLHEALAFSSITWSTVLSVGAVLGGVVAAWFGTDAVFVIDSATYLVSAFFISRVTLPPMPTQAQPFRFLDIVFATDLRRGFTHVKEKGLVPILATKSLWGACGGYLVMLSLVGAERFAEVIPANEEVEHAAAGASAAAISWLFAARGIGTGIGPVLTRYLFGSTERSLRRQITGGFFFAAVWYALFAVAPSLLLACLCAGIAHMGGSTLWVASTAWLQRRVDDAFRSRVFALDFLGMTVSFSGGAVLAGVSYDAWGSIPNTTWLLSGLIVLCGVVWWRLAKRVAIVDEGGDERTDQRSVPS